MLSFKTGTGQQAFEENKLFNSVNTHKEGQHGLSINHGGVTDEKELVDENRWNDGLLVRYIWLPYNVSVCYCLSNRYDATEELLAIKETSLAIIHVLVTAHSAI